MRRVFMILATALLLAVALLGVVPPATAFTNPTIMPDGPARYDVSSSLAIGTGELLTGYYGNRGTVLIEYTDPIYGYQSALLPRNAVATMCADFTSHQQVYVTYNPGTPQAVTGTLNYIASNGSFNATTTPQQAYRHLKRARHELRRARRHHRNYRVIHRRIRAVRRAERELHKALKDYRYCASRRLQ